MSAPDPPPVVPPPEFVARYNLSRAAQGLPALTALDPLVMLGWHFACGIEDALQVPRSAGGA